MEPIGSLGLVRSVPPTGWGTRHISSAVSRRADQADSKFAAMPGRFGLKPRVPLLLVEISGSPTDEGLRAQHGKVIDCCVPKAQRVPDVGKGIRQIFDHLVVVEGCRRDAKSLSAPRYGRVVDRLEIEGELLHQQRRR